MVKGSDSEISTPTAMIAILQSSHSRVKRVESENNNYSSTWVTTPSTKTSLSYAAHSVVRTLAPIHPPIASDALERLAVAV